MHAIILSRFSTCNRVRRAEGVVSPPEICFAQQIVDVGITEECN